MLAGFLSGFEGGHTPLLRRLVLSGMCMEAGGCNTLRGILKSKSLPALQELLIAGNWWLWWWWCLENNIMEKGVLAILLAIREESCPIRLLDLSCRFCYNVNNGRE